MIVRGAWESAAVRGAGSALKVIVGLPPSLSGVSISQEPCHPRSLGPRASRPHFSQRRERARRPRSQGDAQFLRNASLIGGTIVKSAPSDAHRPRNCARAFNAFLAANVIRHTLA